MTGKRINFVDLKAQQEKILPALNERIQKVLAHGQYVLGPEVGELEARLAAYVGVKHAISCSSGTDALLMPLMAYQVGPGDAIFTTPFTFIATAEVIQLLGATPVFVDIDPKTFNIDPGVLGATIAGLGKNPTYGSSKAQGNHSRRSLRPAGGLRCHQRPGEAIRSLRAGRRGAVFWCHL